MPSERVQVSTEDALPVGTSLKVPFGRYPAIVIHTQEGFRAYSAVCTHFACIVDWDSDEIMIVCPCHDGYFEPVNGEVISGPPPTPLTKINVTVENGEIFIGGSA
jgi:nitrite reductase/ring-hydroxylating ferredoxin subunit